MATRARSSPAADAGRADRRARRPPDRRGLRPAANGWPRCAATPRRRACGCGRPGPAIAIVGSERAERRRRPRGRRRPRRHARGRLRAADRRGGGVSAGTQAPRKHAAARTGGDRRRDEPRGRQLPHLLEGDDLLQHARTDRLPARLRPRPRARPWSTKSNGVPYIQFVGTGMVATAVIFSSALPAMFGTFVKHRFQNTYEAILAAPVDVEELVTRRDALDRPALRHLRLRPAAGHDRLRPRPGLGHAAGAALLLRHRARLRRLRRGDGGDRRQDRPVQLRHRALHHAALPRRRHLLPDRRPARRASRSSPSSTRCTSWSNWSAAAPSASRRSTSPASPSSSPSPC